MMTRSTLLLLVTALSAFGQSNPSVNSRLTVSTIVREDFFAGWLSNDMTRLANAEKQLDILLLERPQNKASVLAWKGGSSLFRAVLAHEQKRADEFGKRYNEALDLFNEAATMRPSSVGVLAVTGGSFALFGDRIPEKYRAAGFAKAYDAYKSLWKMQGSTVERMPVHIKGELLAGLAQMAQRTGHAEEASLYVDKMIALLPNSPYEARARKWKENPELAARTSLVCMTCHDAGKLEARRAALAAQ